MNQQTRFPELRSDLEIVAQPSPGKPDRYVIKDPQSGNIIELSEREIFICRQLDGKTPLSVVRSRFKKHYNIPVTEEKLKAFILQLSAGNLLLCSVYPKPVVPYWERMKPVPFYSEKFLAILSKLLNWTISWWFLAIFLVFFVVAFGILIKHWELIISEMFKVINPSNLDIFQRIFKDRFLQGTTLLEVGIFLLLIPPIREICKAITCEHYGCRVREVRYMWYVHLIPCFYSDLSDIYKLEKKHQLHAIAAGLEGELALIIIGIIGWELSSVSSPMNIFCFNLVFAASASLFLNGIPLGRGDGSLFLGQWLGIRDIRNRAVSVSRSWLFRRPLSEPLTVRERHLFRLYGILAEVYYAALNIFFLGIIGYLLVNYFEGTGFLLFVILVILRFEDEIRRFFMKIPFPRWLTLNFTTNKKVKNSLKVLFGLLIITGIYFIPFTYEIGGDFLVQPAFKTEVRSEISAQLKSILVDEGEWVKMGQVIAQLSKRDIQRELDVAKASLEQEDARLRLLEKGPKPEEVAKAEQEVKLRQTNLEYSTNKFERFAELYEKEHISKQEYEDVKGQMDADKEAFELAKRDLELVKTYVKPEEIEAQKAEVARLQVIVSDLKEDLIRTEVLSPIEGQITTMYLKENEGKMINVGDLVSLVEDNRTIISRITVPEEYSGEIKINSQVWAKPWAYPGKIFEGRVTKIAPVVVDKSEDILNQAMVKQEKGTVRSINAQEEKIVGVVAELDNKNGLLKSGLTGYAKIRVGIRPLGSIILGPIIRFFRVEVWSWLP